ncbi:MAG TPA: hypothetical protein VM899_10290 [Rubellimicrobium sp.]|nr:hypothetical protein [Rubellimicrobium sp.]
MNRRTTLAATMAVVIMVPPAAVAQEEITFPTLNEDGATMYADRYAHEGERSRGTALLFHDMNSGAIEYADIAPRLAALGFEVLAVDLRTGSEDASVGNRTYQSTAAFIYTTDDGLPDAQGALAWARETLPDDPILLWGSGAPADMVIVMAADDPKGIAGVLAFSPPSMLVHSDEAEAASKLIVPLFVSYATAPKDELATVSQITDAAPPELLTLYTPEVGAHGVATLTESGNPEGWEANWAAVEAFLDQVAP